LEDAELEKDYRSTDGIAGRNCRVRPLQSQIEVTALIAVDVQHIFLTADEFALHRGKAIVARLIRCDAGPQMMLARRKLHGMGFMSLDLME
jgi:hypothetical protein